MIKLQVRTNCRSYENVHREPIKAKDRQVLLMWEGTRAVPSEGAAKANVPLPHAIVGHAYSQMQKQAYMGAAGTGMTCDVLTGPYFEISASHL